MAVMAIEKISEKKIKEIKRRSVLSISNNPSEKGLSPQQIKTAIVQPVIDTIVEVNRIVDEINNSGIPKVVIDNEMSSSSVNLVQNRVVKQYVDGKIDEVNDRITRVDGKVDSLGTFVDSEGLGTILNILEK